MNIQEYEISEVVPYKNNPRINVDAVNVVKKSLKEFGFQQPLVIDKDNKIVVGHTRLLAAKELGFKTVPCVVANNLSDEQIKAYRIMDNKSSEYASWNYGLLTKEVTDLLEADYDLNLTGFDEFELKDLGINIDLGFAEEPQTNDDDAPDLPENPISKLGDVWQLGNHKLVCGDSTIQDDLDKLVGNAKIQMVFTDPPYNADYTSRVDKQRRKQWGSIINDNMSKDDFTDFLIDINQILWEVMDDGASVYECIDWKRYPQMQNVFEQVFNQKAMIIWNKNYFGLGTYYRTKHEIVLFGCKGEKLKTWNAGHDEMDVWDIARDNATSYKHPTQKPVSISLRALNNTSKKKDNILDLFLGSGSTLIACEKLYRNCYAMELDPKYCDVAIQRWQNYTGKDAIHLETNKTYNELQKNTKNGE